MRRLALPTACTLLFIAGSCWAALTFPALSGRVVDDAHILSDATRQTLEQELAGYENGTSNQVVVATIGSLQGDSIEDYGYQLGRQWGIGQKGKDNGAVLIVAPNERKVRIEVGYGLEPVLTDAASSQIINSVIVPDFRAGQMEQGVIDGTHAMLAVLGGKASALPQTQAASEPLSPLQWVLLLVFLMFFLRFAFRHPFLTAYMLSGNTSRFGSSGFGGGGFSGGGGSFGGGGSSGQW